MPRGQNTASVTSLGMVRGDTLEKGQDAMSGDQRTWPMQDGGGDREGFWDTPAECRDIEQDPHGKCGSASRERATTDASAVDYAIQRVMTAEGFEGGASASADARRVSWHRSPRQTRSQVAARRTGRARRASGHPAVPYRRQSHRHPAGLSPDAGQKRRRYRNGRTAQST
jgi:hypothetical protein